MSEGCAPRTTLLTFHFSRWLADSNSVGSVAHSTFQKSVNDTRDTRGISCDTCNAGSGDTRNVQNRKLTKNQASVVEESGRKSSTRDSSWLWCGGAPRRAAGAGGQRLIGCEGNKHGSAVPWRNRRQGGGGGRMVWPPASSRPTRRWCWRWRRWRWSRAAAARLRGGGADGDVEAASRRTRPREPRLPRGLSRSWFSGLARPQGFQGLPPRHPRRKGRSGNQGGTRHGQILSRRLPGRIRSPSYRRVHLGEPYQQPGESHLFWGKQTSL